MGEGNVPIDADLLIMIAASEVGMPAQLSRRISAVNGLASQRVDLRQCIGALDMREWFGSKLVPEVAGRSLQHSVIGIPVDIRNLLLLSAVILYSRCFRTSNLRIQSRHRRKLPSELKKVHDKMMRLRDKYVAHVEDEDLIDDRTRLRINPNQCEASSIDILFTYQRMIDLSNDEKQLFRELVVAVHDRVDRDILDQTKSIVRELSALRSIQEWVALALAHPPRAVL